MKNYIVLFFVLALWCAFLPCLRFIDLSGDVSASVPSCSAEESAEAETATPCFSAADTRLVLYVKETNTAKSVELEEYVACALAAVMAEDSPVEALKAQAIAIRSLALNRKHSPVHHGFDMCTDPFCCYPVAETTSATYINIATETDDVILCYRGAPVMALSHLSSCISTEAYGEEFPYLSCVRVEDEKGFACYKTLYSYTKGDFKRRFEKNNIAFTEDHNTWVGESLFTDGNRVRKITLCGTELTGDRFAAALGLDSLCFSVTPTEHGFDVVCYGSGNGYGMSRCSALIMAAHGADYAKILQRFYPNTVITKLIK